MSPDSDTTMFKTPFPPSVHHDRPANSRLGRLGEGQRKSGRGHWNRSFFALFPYSPSDGAVWAGMKS